VNPPEGYSVRPMRRTFETARMYTGGQPDIDASRIWGVTSFELG